MEEQKNEQNQIVGYISNISYYKAFVSAVQKRAKKEGAGWSILFLPDSIDTRRYSKESDAIIQAEKYITGLGGEFIVIKSAEFHNAISKFLSKDKYKGCGILYVQKGRKSKPFNMVGMTFADYLSKRLGREIKVIELGIINKHLSPLYFLIKNDNIKAHDILISIAATSMVFAFFEVFFYLAKAYGISGVKLSDVAPILMITSFALTIYSGLISGAISLLCSMLLITFLYIEPISTNGSNLMPEQIHLLIFLVCNIIGNILCASLKAENIIIKNNKKILRTLFEINSITSREINIEKVIAIFQKEVTELLCTNTSYYSINKNGKRVQSIFSSDQLDDETEKLVIEVYEFEESRKFPVKVDGHNFIRHLMPINVDQKKHGVIGIDVPFIFRKNSSYLTLIDSIGDLFTDLLERSRLINEIKANELRLEQEKLRSTLLSSVSHDFKTPLSSIICSLQQYKRMQHKGTLTQEIADNLISISIEESERLSRFITNMLSITQLENDLIDFRYDWVNPDDLIYKTVKSFRSKCSKIVLKNIANSSRCKEIYADYIMMETTLCNILENAVKYSTRKPIVTISTGIVSDKFVLQIEDNGPGIPENRLSKIFDKYERARFADTQTAGTGLGLCIVKNIIEKHQGEVFALNKSVGGAMFIIKLPQYRRITDESD